jgi:serine phosphatase RsbU (regulator of sigma subunit)/putative methionine-R-sulfoxide reductase with GAF domain
VNRERRLILYCVAVGTVGWVWLLLSGPFSTPWPILLLFLALALLVESAGFRIPPSDPHSLVGIVLVTAALALGPPGGALLAAFSGFIFGVLLPLIYGRPRTFYLMAARPFLRSGVRAIAILLGGALAALLAPSDAESVARLAIFTACYALVIQLNRVLREFLQGGRTGVITWFRSSWRPALSAEIAPLPVAALGAAIYTGLGTIYFALAGACLLAASLTVRRAALNLQRQRRSVRELAQLNEVSRAIIRAELDVDELCELIYREASKVVDTSSFHLGLFEPSGDRYTLVVRVQDRVRLPPLGVDLPSGDGIVGWMRETGRALLVEDFATEMDQLPARPRYQSERPPRSGIYVPLIAGEAVIGSISIQGYRPRAFDADDMRLLSLIADQAAVAISKARAFADASQRAVQLQAIHEVSERITAILDLDALLPSVVQLIQERFGYHPVHIFTLEDDSALVFRASTAQGEALARLRQIALRRINGIVGAAAVEQRPVLVNDVRQDPRYIGDDWHTLAELAVPLRFGDQNIGVLDVQSAEAGRFHESDLFVMQTLADQIAVAIESARAFTAQREEAWTLNSLLQVAENIARASSLDELLLCIVRLPPLLLGCDRCYVLVWSRERGIFTPLAAYGLTPEQRAMFIGKSFDEAAAPLLAEARRTMMPIELDEAQARQYMCPPILGPFGGGALVALPLTARGATLGMLVADYSLPDHRFTPREMTLYAGIANQIAGALESALLAQEAAEAARLDEELRVARDIQTALLPASIPNLPGWEIAADWRSARLVGGDFYDFWRLPPRQADREARRQGDESATDVPLSSDLRVSRSSDRADLGFVIADVSDKGVPAAMFMALSRSLMRAAALDGSSPSVALGRANRWITRDSESAMFVTLFYGILQPETGVLRYGCAGHNPPLLFRATDGAVSELTTPGIALGVLEDVVLGEDTVTLAPGDILVCYTDGITEAINGAEEAFGVARLIETVAAHREYGAIALVAAINGALLRFTERPPFDDLTLVVIKREPEPQEQARDDFLYPKLEEGLGEAPKGHPALPQTPHPPELFG